MPARSVEVAPLETGLSNSPEACCGKLAACVATWAGEGRVDCNCSEGRESPSYTGESSRERIIDHIRPP
jgi:hypothetical protein